jgi:hypothetical protein
LGVAGIASFLRRHRNIALDTSSFIYQIQAHPAYVELTNAVFVWIEEPRHQAFISTIIMAELLVHSYRENDRQQIDSFYGFFPSIPICIGFHPIWKPQVRLLDYVQHISCAPPMLSRWLQPCARSLLDSLQTIQCLCESKELKRLCWIDICNFSSRFSSRTLRGRGSWGPGLDRDLGYSRGC